MRNTRLVLLIASIIILLVRCEKPETTRSYITIDGQEWELHQGYYKLFTRSANDANENWHQLALYSKEINEGDGELSGSGVFVHMNLHPLDSSSIEGNYTFKDAFVNDGSSASELFPSISILSPDSTIEYGDLKTGTRCDVTLQNEKYLIEIEGYIIEWNELDGVWVEGSIPFSIYYEGELEDK